MTTHPHLEGLIQNWHVRGNDWASGLTHADDAISAINDAVIAERIRVLDRCRHELEAALAALPGGGVDGWQPMETAPKSAADGSRVSGIYLLGFVPDAEMDFDPNACIDIVWWEPLLPNKAGTRGKWCRSAGDTTVECEPTHWRPLPATPAALATFAEGV